MRIEPGLHHAVATAAKRAGVSLNKWVARLARWNAPEPKSDLLPT